MLRISTNLFLAAFMIIGFSACDNNGSDDGNASGKMEANIGGSSWEADNATATTFGASGFETLTIAGATASTEALTVSFFNVNSTGTFDLSGASLASMSWTPAAVGPNDTYIAQSGSATISKIDDNEVEGTFSFDAVRPSDNATITVTNGSFDVGYGPAITAKQ